MVFDKVKEKDIKLTTNITGELEDGYVATIKQLSTDEVTVYGPESEFDKLNNVIAEINVNGKSDDFTAELKPVVFNTNGAVLPNFIVSPSDITGCKKIKDLLPGNVIPTEDKIVEVGELTGFSYHPGYGDMDGAYHFQSLEKNEDGDWVIIVSDKDNFSEPLIIRTYEVSQFINDPRISTKSTTPRVITVTIELAGKDGKNITLDAEDIKVSGLASGLKALMPSQVVLFVLFRQYIGWRRFP